MSRRRTTCALLIAALAAVPPLATAAPANAGVAFPPKTSFSVDTVRCGVAVHLDVTGTEPFVYTGRSQPDSDVGTIDAGRLTFRYTEADGRWVQASYAGPSVVMSDVPNGDGTRTQRVRSAGVRAQWESYDGALVRDSGDLVADYVVSFADGFQVLGRSTVSERGSFPIWDGKVSFCDFFSEHMS